MKQASFNWIEHFEGLNHLPENLKEELIAGSRVVEISEGTQVFEHGQSSNNLLLLLEGTMRVRQKSDTGREIFLYRANAGESCVMTSAFMLAFEDTAVDGMAETDVRAVSIPRRTFDDMMARSQVFREFILKSYSRRISDLMELIDDLVFQRMDVRLASRLLELAQDGVVRATHQTLGNELGTAREVISRMLSEFQRRGLVEQSRGEVRILNSGGLERLARSNWEK